jgi:hypothetical protein
MPRTDGLPTPDASERGSEEMYTLGEGDMTVTDEIGEYAAGRRSSNVTPV